MNFADNLREARKNKGFTQEQLAEVLGISRQSISKWESGIALPEMDKLSDISKVLDVTADFLINGKDAEKVITEDNGKAEDKKDVRSSDKILIKSYDGKHVVNCIRVSAAPILYPTKREPKFILHGTDKVGFLGEHNTVLAFYADEESVQKEIEEIYYAMSQGEAAYELKYYAEIEMKGLTPKLKKE